MNASRSWKPGTLSYGNGCTYKMPVGNAEEMAKLDASYEHLCKMRDELVTLNIVPPISEWNKINRSIVLSRYNVSKKDGVLYLPLYMAMFL